MSLITNIGRAGKVSYGTGATTEFRVSFNTNSIQDPTGLEFINGQLSPTVVVNPKAPVTGNLTIAGVTVTLTASDILSPVAVATKIASTAIAGFTVYSRKDIVYLTSTTITTTAIAQALFVPVVLSAGTTNVNFVDIKNSAGIPIPSGTISDDIFVGGRTPISATVTFTGGAPTLWSSVGSPAEQANGTLVYVSVPLTGGSATISAPVNYLRVINTGGTSTQITLLISR